MLIAPGLADSRTIRIDLLPGGLVMHTFRRIAVFAAAAVMAVAPSTAAHAATITLRSELNNKCLEIYAFNANNGAQVGMWDCWGGANQSWYWNGEELRNTMNNKCLEIYAFNANNAAKVGMWDCWGGANQHWYRVGNEIRNRLNNKCLEVYAFNANNGARSGMWDCWGGANQHWY
jgi:hypothetical protein